MNPVTLTPKNPQPSREVHCGDALLWLRGREVIEGESFVTSLPDISEMAGLTLADWRGWFHGAARAVIEACPSEGAAIFFQSDVVVEGEWIDKGYLVERAAEEVGARLLWHRVVARGEPGSAGRGRASYSHMLCFSRGLRLRAGWERVDVMPEAGAVTWTRGMGVAACREACGFARAEARSRVIVDPFCGVGTVLAVANAMGMDAVGVELVRRRAQRARNLRVEL